nr:S1/P1 nuclease [Bradyrhizobium brasilense]
MLSGHAFAWGQEGHSIIAEIAQRRLTPQAAAVVEQLLGKGHSLASIGSWADNIRDQRPATYNWHFVDIPVADSDFQPPRDCVPDPNKGDCVVAELTRLAFDLRNASGAARIEALKYAVHFVGDIHQPLHSVLEQRGGNGIDVQLTMRGHICTGSCQPVTAHTNLHAAWDSGLILRTVYDWGAFVDSLEQGWLAGPEAQTPGINGGSPADWAVDTHKVGQTVWALTPANKVLDDAYYNQILPIMDRQLGVAGLRLARFLNEAFVEIPAPADPRLGCDTVKGPPVPNLSEPDNIDLFKKKLLYYRCASYEADVAHILSDAQRWIAARAVQVERPAIVLDIDETSLSNWPRVFKDDYAYIPNGRCEFNKPGDPCGDLDWQQSGLATAIEPTRKLYDLVRCNNQPPSCTKVDVFFVTGRREAEHNGEFASVWTLRNLKAAGFGTIERDHLYMRDPNATDGVSDHKTRARIDIEGRNYTIIANIGDQQSDLINEHADMTFKVPNPFYFIQ